jgi:hypothetical protein
VETGGEVELGKEPPTPHTHVNRLVCTKRKEERTEGKKERKEGERGKQGREREGGREEGKKGCHVTHLCGEPKGLSPAPQPKEKD